MRRHRTSTQIRRGAGLPIALAGALTLTGCADSAGPEEGTTAEDVADAEPDAGGGVLLGRDVTISAAADEVIGEGAVVLDAGDATDELLVLAADGTFEALESAEDVVDEERVLQVQGTVRRLDVAALEEELGLDWDDEEIADWEGEAVLVADRLDTLAGESLTFAGDVTELLGTTAFRVAGSGWDVVVLDAEQAQVEVGDYVQVSGTVRRFELSAVEAEYGAELEEAVYEPYVGDLVLVADTVTVTEPAGPPAGA
ncbi:hypothetical protein [Actinotalea sp. Marseille-Q4924]|uniref:hypothetical protein n=1 Tax=Actinotalea sp. Marseille-Q4924 TaxID=2866571 RepID=UPI001CE46566|nr:hypothetical protein [Actinotalea sp. Marseille-Q4924]